MSRRNNSQNRGGNQLQRMENMMMDPFANMRQMMRGFGGFDDHDMFSLMPRMNDPFQDMFKFSDLHKNVHNKGKEGSYVCQTFVSSSTMGQDGKMKSQNYYANEMGQHQGGQTISQKKQAYKNSDGVNRIAQERMLGDKGRKIVKQKLRNGPIEQTNHYYNIDQEQAQHFDNQWSGTNQKMKFLENNQKYIQNGHHQEKPRMINYQPSRVHQPQRRMTKQPNRQIIYEKNSRQNPSSVQSSIRNKKF